MDKTIYNIENRGYPIIGHWFFYMLAGLYDIVQCNPTHTGQDGGPNSPYYLEHNVWNRNVQVKDKIKICFHNQVNDPGTTWKSQGGFNDFNFQTLELISDKFEFITDIGKFIDQGYQIINNYGVHINKGHSYPFVNPNNILYLRNLFLQGRNYIYDKNKYIYISRHKSNTCKGSPSDGIHRRTIKNEDTLYNNYLSILGFKLIYLEDYNVEDKIKLFNTSSIIVSPNGGALTFTIFANANTHLVEIAGPFTCPGFYEQWAHLTKMLGISYKRYPASVLDNMDNMHVDEKSLYAYLQEIIPLKSDNNKLSC